jgi:hypothetical protein
MRDEQPGSYFLEFRNHFLGKILKFFDADPGSGMEKFGSGMEKFVYGMEKFGSGTEKVGSGIRDKHPGSATLESTKYTRRICNFQPDRWQCLRKALFKSMLFKIQKISTRRLTMKT